MACHQHGAPDDPELAEQRAGTILFAHTGGGNRTNGPVAGLLGSLAAFELLRFLTRFEEPAYAGATLELDFLAGCASRLHGPWPRDPACRVCGQAEFDTALAGADHQPGTKGGDMR
jgi:hypothetical protein